VSGTHVYADNGFYTVTVCVTDDNGGVGCDTLLMTVRNVAPTVGPISAPADPVLFESAIVASAAFSDPGVHDTHTALFDWGDGTASAGTVTEANGSGSVSGIHDYTTPGVYTITLTLTDKDGGAGQVLYQYVVVYDPDGGFVTGGGWIWSPAGANAADPALEGKASFGFVAKYKKGANVPDGNTQFQFKAGGLNFQSSSYEWLVIAGAQAKFKGVGTLNDAGEYGFLLTAEDGQVNGGGGTDTFRIKIWDIETGSIVYDNQIGDTDAAAATTELGGGSIVIHKAK
jgi:PKD repeat protein